MQVIADAVGRLVWASPALPGSAHDLTAARTHGIIAALTSADVMTFTDAGLPGRPGQRADTVQAAPFPAEAATPVEGGQPRHAKIRALGERAIATLKAWKILTKLRCCPRRATAIVQAIIVLRHVEAASRPARQSHGGPLGYRQ